MSGVVNGLDGVDIPVDGVRALSCVIKGWDGVGIGLDGVAAASGAINVGMVSVLH